MCAKEGRARHIIDKFLPVERKERYGERMKSGPFEIHMDSDEDVISITIEVKDGYKIETTDEEISDRVFVLTCEAVKQACKTCGRK